MDLLWYEMLIKHLKGAATLGHVLQFCYVTPPGNVYLENIIPVWLQSLGIVPVHTRSI